MLSETYRSIFEHPRLRMASLAIGLTIGVVAMGLNAGVFASPVLSGQVCSENVGRLTQEIGWSRDLEKLQAEAAAQDKLILWVHMVGKLDGFT